MFRASRPLLPALWPLVLLCLTPALLGSTFAGAAGARSSNQTATGSEPVASPLQAPIAAVTLSPAGALVRRQGQVPGPGRFSIGPLPGGLDERALTLRVEGGEVGQLLLSPPAPRTESGRLAELTQRGEQLQRRAAELEREKNRLRSLDAGVKARLEGLGQAGAAAPKELEQVLEWASERLNKSDQRGLEIDGELALVSRQIYDLENELEALPRSEVRELFFEVVLPAGQAGRLELEYPVDNCGWMPLYDLRAKGLVQPNGEPTIELVTRAEVRQATGEDWNGVRLELTSALPQRGAQRPEPPRFVARLDQGADSDFYGGESAPRAAAPPGSPLATLDAERAFEVWVVPGLAELPSSTGSRSLLVARQSLPLVVEHYAVPAIDSGVWRVGRVRYQGEHSLLPGPAAVYLDGDFVGRADLERRQSGEELELPLGIDPRLRVERISLIDRTQAPGLFGSRRKQEQRWRVKLIQGGGRAQTVFVQESLPVAADSRIAVELTSATAKLAAEERFKKLREERGQLTFQVSLPAEGTLEFEWGYSLTYPDSLQLDLHPER